MKFLILIAAIAAVRWVWLLWRHPFAPCRRCKGKGTNPGSSRKMHGRCRRCKGARERQRFGARWLHKGLRAARERQRQRSK
jgi:hypothetical protein